MKNIVKVETIEWYAEVKMWSLDHLMTISEGGKVEKGMHNATGGYTNEDWRPSYPTIS